MKKILIIGAGGHAKSCIEVIENSGIYKISGLIGLPSEVGNSVFGYEVIGTDSDLKFFASEHENAMVAVGQLSSSKRRQELFKTATEFGFKMPSMVSKYALVSPRSKVGYGTIVMPGVLIRAGVHLGENCIINSNALIEHDVEIASHCHISTGVIINGGVEVGAGTFVGSGAVIKQELVIGSESIIGMGTTVRRNIADREIYIGRENT